MNGLTLYKIIILTGHHASLMAIAKHVNQMLIDRAIEELTEMICDCDPSEYRKNPCKRCRRIGELQKEKELL